MTRNTFGMTMVGLNVQPLAAGHYLGAHSAQRPVRKYDRQKFPNFPWAVLLLVERVS
jgi:hypothetical protein